jgi:hypothetical protein
VLKALKRLLTPLPKKGPPVMPGALGFAVATSWRDEVPVRWRDVREIRAFKLDHRTWDEVRFAFRLSDGEWIEVSEDQEGFQAFVAELELRYPSVRGWRDSVIEPRFARNETVLYRG